MNEKNCFADSTTEKLSETRREIQMVKQKLDDLMSRPPPNQIPRMEGKRFYVINVSVK